jgi:TonB dependent receptor.
MVLSCVFSLSLSAIRSRVNGWHRLVFRIWNFIVTYRMYIHSQNTKGWTRK